MGGADTISKVIFKNRAVAILKVIKNRGGNVDDELLQSKEKAFKSMELNFNDYSEDGGKSIPESSYGLFLEEIGQLYDVKDLNADEVLMVMESDDGEK